MLAVDLADTALDFLYPAMQALSPAPTGQSYSHLPLVFFENSEVAKQQPGAHSLELRIVDALKQGWQVSVGYTVN